jgi:prolyl 4-hydroxylase
MSQRDRARIGRRGRRCLESNQDVICFTRSGLDVYIVKDFISETDRRAVKRMIKSNMSQSGTLGGSYPTFSSFRTSSTSHLAHGDEVVQALDERVASLIGVDVLAAESTQGQHYAVGQTFKPHCDFFHEVQPLWRRWRREGGQRTWTAMAYLDDEVDGGDTRFVNVGFKIKPVAGMLVLWNNMTPEGLPNFDTMHEGAPILAGEKTIITKWFRERTWKPLPPREAERVA